jgi:hypothetical protein
VRNLSDSWRAWKGRVVKGSVILIPMFLAYLGVGFVQIHRHPSPAAVRAQNTATPFNPFAAANGKHLIAYVVTASDCGWSTRPVVMRAVAGLRDRLRSVHGASFARVRVVGIALDEDVGAGLRFLNKLGFGEGTFDQVMVGGSWLNEQIVRFVWRDTIAEAASPQIVVIERPIDTALYALTFKIVVNSDTVLANPVGNEQIIAWINNSVPLTRVANAKAVATR